MNKTKSYEQLIEEAKENLKNLQTKETNADNESRIKTIKTILNIHDIVGRAKVEQQEISRLLKETDEIMADILQAPKQAVSTLSSNNVFQNIFEKMEQIDHLGKNQVNKDKLQESIKKIRVDIENGAAVNSDIKPK